MKEKVLLLDKSAERCKKLASQRAEKEDLIGSLSFLFSALEKSSDHEVLMSIADTYADMNLFELSNRYWYKYIFNAPADKVAIAYEELAINYFYMDNLWASGYYFHKKLSVDGYITKEGLDPEILDFFSGEEFKKNAYRIVYPPEKAKFDLEIKNGKRAISLGAFKEGAILLNKIPPKSRDEEIAGDLAIALLMSDDLAGAEEECRRSLLEHGESVTAYCNLSTISDMKEDFGSSEYYYQKALTLRKGAPSEPYKIATCAIEREDHQTVRECLIKILQERPYELSMRFFYGIALINLGEYKSAEEQLKKAYSLDRTDLITEYYLQLAKSLSKSSTDAEKLLPLKYVREIPKQIAVKWSKKIRDVIKTPEKIPSFIKNEQNKSIIKWGMLYGTDTVMRASVLIVSSGDIKAFRKQANDLLMNPEVRDDLKRLLIYVLIIKSVKRKIGLVYMTFYNQFTPKKLLCEKDVDGTIYQSAYALCMAKVAFTDVEDLNKVALTTDVVYSKFKNILTESEVTNEELAGFILFKCGYDKFSSQNDILKNFEISEYKLNKLIELFDKQGERYDKNY